MNRLGSQERSDCLWGQAVTAKTNQERLSEFTKPSAVRCFSVPRLVHYGPQKQAILILIGAEEKSRTSTLLRGHGPEPCASAIPPLRHTLTCFVLS